MKLPTWKRIIKQDYEQAVQSVIDKLALSINNAMDSIFSTLNRNVSLRDNILCTVKDVSVQVDANGNPLQTATMSLDQTNKVDGLVVIRVTNLTDSQVYPTGYPFITFTQASNSSVTFNNIKGLQAGYQWQLRVVAFQI